MKAMVVVLTMLIAVSGFSFPMRGLEKNAVIELQKFSLKDNTPLKDNSPFKMLVIWRSDKRLSKKQYEVFKEFCTEEKVNCLAVDTTGSFHEDANVTSAVDKNGYTDTWGLITVPVTILLDGQNRIIDAMGYEGQYKHKMSEIIKNFRK